MDVTWTKSRTWMTKECSILKGRRLGVRLPLNDSQLLINHAQLLPRYLYPITFHTRAAPSTCHRLVSASHPSTFDRRQLSYNGHHRPTASNAASPLPSTPRTAYSRTHKSPSTYPSTSPSRSYAAASCFTDPCHLWPTGCSSPSRPSIHRALLSGRSRYPPSPYSCPLSPPTSCWLVLQGNSP